MKRKLTKSERIQKLKKCADHLWSLKVLERDGKCQFPQCNVHANVLHPHHIFGRGNLSTRWNPKNGCVLCFTHHRRAHDDPMSMYDFFVNYLGVDSYENLKRQSKAVMPINEEILLEIITLLENS